MKHGTQKHLVDQLISLISVTFKIDPDSEELDIGEMIHLCFPMDAKVFEAQDESKSNSAVLTLSAGWLISYNTYFRLRPCYRQPDIPDGYAPCRL